MEYKKGFDWCKNYYERLGHKVVNEADPVGKRTVGYKRHQLVIQKGTTVIPPTIRTRNEEDAPNFIKEGDVK